MSTPSTVTTNDKVQALLKRHTGVSKIWQTTDGLLFLKESDARVQQGNLNGKPDAISLVYDAESQSKTKTTGSPNISPNPNPTPAP